MTEIDLTPVTRLEYDIDAILNDHAVAEPITRIELILADIVAGNTTTVEPVTRIETYLAIISGADYPVPEPVTRIETFLAIIAGEDYETPEAVTRLEGLLAEWVEKGSGIWKTVTGALIHITDAIASPMQKCEVTLEPIQSGSGDPSPTNVRPITGWTGCEVTRTGANLFGGLEFGSEVANTVPDSTLDTTAKTVVFSNGKNVPDPWFSSFKENTRYTIILSLSNTQENHAATNIRVRYTDNTTVNMQKSGTSKQTIVYNTVSGKTVYCLEYASQIGTTTLYYDESGIFEGVLTADDFEPYSGTTLSVTFPDTVYGGSHEFVSGGLKSKMASVDMGTLPWVYISNVSNPYFQVFFIGQDAPKRQTRCLTSIGFEWKSTINGSTTDDFAIAIPDNGYLRVRDTRFNDADSFKSAMSGVQLVYELATPITIQLTSQEISTLKGENNVWSNTNGDTTVIYKAQAE